MRWVTGAAPHVLTWQGLPKVLREMAWEMNPIKGSPGNSSWLMDTPNTLDTHNWVQCGQKNVHQRGGLSVHWSLDFFSMTNSLRTSTAPPTPSVGCFRDFPLLCIHSDFVYFVPMKLQYEIHRELLHNGD